MKRFLFLLTLVSSASADFQSKIGYAITVPASSQWGVAVQVPDNPTTITVENNKSVAGVVTGQAMGVVCCPCLKYGAKEWSDAAITTYQCDAAQEAAAKTAQSTARGAAKACAVTEKANNDVVDFSQYFTRVQQFAQGINAQLTKVLNEFPDSSQGEGLHSTEFITFCKSYGASNIPKTSQPFALQGQLAEAKGNLSVADDSGNNSTPLIDISQYFPNQQFVVALDFTQLADTQLATATTTSGK